MTTPLTKTENAELLRRDLEAAPRQDLELVLTPEIVAKLVKQAELRQDFFNKILPVALKGTRADGWMDFGGNPWPRTFEAERLRRDFGISVTHVRYEYEEGTDERGPWFSYTCLGLFSSDVFGTLEINGHAGSRDQFFAKEHDTWKPASEVDRPSIKQSAYANMLQNGVTRMLGMRGLPWQVLTELSGGVIRQEAAGTVRFRDRGRSAGAGQPPAAPGQEPTPTAAGEAAAPSKVQELGDLLDTLDVTDAQMVEVIRQATAFKDFRGFDTLAGVMRAKQPEKVAEIAASKLRQRIKDGELKVKAAAAPPQTPETPQDRPPESRSDEAPVDRQPESTTVPEGQTSNAGGTVRSEGQTLLLPEAKRDA